MIEITCDDHTIDQCTEDDATEYESYRPCEAFLDSTNPYRIFVSDKKLCNLCDRRKLRIDHFQYEVYPKTSNYDQSEMVRASVVDTQESKKTYRKHEWCTDTDSGLIDEAIVCVFARSETGDEPTIGHNERAVMVKVVMRW